MNTNRSLLILTLALFVGACAPVTSYTDAEAPKRLKLDSATTQLNLHFAPGTANLSPADAAHLRDMAATGRIGAADRVVIAAAGTPLLTEERIGAVARVLLNYGVVAVVGSAVAPPNQAVVEVTRTLVTLPPCPNWSKSSNTDFANQPSSNFGCATETNLGMMVANPADLASGLPVGSPAGLPAAAAVNRYLNDKVVLPTANTALPVAVGSSSQQGNTGGSGSSPTGTGSGSGGS
jgi:pilus assembly protein CpaD